MKVLSWITLTLCVQGLAVAAGEKPTVPHAIETPIRFDSRLGFVATPVVFITDTKPALEAAGVSRFDLIEARDIPAGRKAVGDSPDFRTFMNDTLREATDSVSHVRLLRYESTGTYSPDTLDLKLPKQAKGVPIGAWVLGLVITEVQPGGLAESKGVEPGFFVEAVNGQRGGARTTATAMFLAAQEAVAQKKPLELLLVKWRPLPKSGPDANPEMTGKKKTVVFLPEELAPSH